MVFDVRAYAALLLFVPIAIAVFGGSKNKLAAFVALYFGGTLFLPEHAALDFPLLPPLNKNGFVAMVGLLGAVVFMRGKLRSSKPFRGVDLAFLIVVLGNFGTALTNTDPQVFGDPIKLPNGEVLGETIMLQGMTPYEIVSNVTRDFIGVFLPFFLGRALFRTREDAVILLRGAVVFGLIYIPLMLFEMRMSPQLHNWTYGYHANLVSHAARGGGFKPTVYLNNGLAVAMFILATILCAAALMKARHKIFGMPSALPLALLFGALMVSRNVGAAIYALAAVPTVLVSGGKTASRMAMVLVLLVVSYPSTRASGIFPADELTEFAGSYSEERAQSLHTRFFNEDILYERASERLTFGWGGYGRNRIFDRFGKDVSITDGEWIIWVGGRGIVGFTGLFGLLLLPILSARRKIKRIRRPEDKKIIDAMILLCALNAVDLLPNGLFTKLPFMWAGALAGLASGMAKQSDEESRQPLARAALPGK